MLYLFLNIINIIIIIMIIIIISYLWKQALKLWIGFSWHSSINVVAMTSCFGMEREGIMK